MHNMHLNSKVKLFKTKTSRFKTAVNLIIIGVITKIAFMLAIIIDAKIVKIKASFFVV